MKLITLVYIVVLFIGLEKRAIAFPNGIFDSYVFPSKEEISNSLSTKRKETTSCCVAVTTFASFPILANVRTDKDSTSGPENT